MSKILEIICFCWHKKGCKDCDLNNHPIYGMCRPKIEEEKIRKLIPKKKEFNPISIVEKICIKKEREGYNKAIDEVNKKLFG